MTVSHVTADCAICLSIRVRGQVQAVGFRPFVWQLATRHGLVGEVWNDGSGVVIVAQGPSPALKRLLAALREEAPPLARVTAIEAVEAETVPTRTSFVIAESRHGPARTAVVADAATCAACRDEIFTPGDRREGYAFGNCTHCGPRLSIIAGLPYDRATTSMANFALCPQCAAEYADPADRRFHAQPIACPTCGPRLSFHAATPGKAKGTPLAATVAMLRAGGTVAIKGIGGYHLACLASDEAAVARLRQRKQRDAKPFALMAGSVAMVRRHCHVSSAEAELLAGPAAPIVLLDRLPEGPSLPHALAPDQHRLGFMLAHSPLHHLLMAELGEPLVMTSGNRSSEPPAMADDEARDRLGTIADAWLSHDRAIVNRCDDSVVAHDSCGPMVLRRARGLAPAPILLPQSLAAKVPVLAMGGALKATFCLLRGNEAILSPHIGDLEDALALADYRRMLDLFCDLFAFRPGLIAIDAHPDYLSSRLGRDMARRLGVPLVCVPHHHAHMASCLAENEVEAEYPALGLICDGLGLGADGTLWGGEVLAGTCRDSQRIGGLPSVPLPGGAAAMRQPWRNLLAHLVHAFGPAWRSEIPALAEIWPEPDALAMVEMALDRGINSPPCSSAGRLFDAVAAALGIHPERLDHEAQAAMALEACAAPHLTHSGAYAIPLDRSATPSLRLAPLWQAIAADLARGIDRGIMAARFHLGLADALAALIVPMANGKPGLPIALSGGIFQNRIMRVAIAERLTEAGLAPLNHHLVPANDGGLSLGQAVVAARRMGDM